MSKAGLASQLLLFFGILFFILGAFGAGRTVVNLQMFEKYPMEGAIPSNLLISNNFAFSGYQSELDCTSQVGPYYDLSGNPREATEVEKQTTDMYAETCMQRVSEARQRAKINDMGMSAFFLITGLGLLVARNREW